jgi:hypothetical protein
MTKTGSGPAKTLPGKPPRGRADGTGLCCACPADGKIKTVGDKDYFDCDYNPGWRIKNKGKIALARTATAGTVTIRKTFRLSYSNGATEAAHQGTISSAIASAMAAWTAAASTWRVQITQPGCDVQKLRMVFVQSVTPDAADVEVTVDNKAPATLPDGTVEELRSYVLGGTSMNFYAQAVGSITWTMIHEVGHTMGLPDEYTYDRTAAAPAPVCTYKGADDPDKAITLTPSTVPAGVGYYGFDNPSVMGQFANVSYPDNLFYWVAIEVKKLLKKQGVNADVKIVSP